MELLSRFKRTFSCRGAANPGIRPGEPLHPTDTQHMCSLARALREGGKRNGGKGRGAEECTTRGRGVGDSHEGSRVKKIINMKRRTWAGQVERSKMTASYDLKYNSP